MAATIGAQPSPPVSTTRSRPSAARTGQPFPMRLDRRVLLFLRQPALRRAGLRQRQRVANGRAGVAVGPHQEPVVQLAQRKISAAFD